MNHLLADVRRLMAGASITLTDDELEAIAKRAAEIVSAQQAIELVDDYMTTSQAADYLACGIKRIYGLVEVDDIPYRKDGSRLLFRRSELDAWLTDGGGKLPAPLTLVRE